MQRTAFWITMLVFISFLQLIAQLPPYSDEWRWVHFSTDDGLPSNRVLDLSELSDGTVWVNTNNGLAFYNGYHWTSIDSAHGLPVKTIYSFLTTPAGEVLVTGSDSNTYIGNTNGFKKLVLQYNNITIQPYGFAYYLNGQYLAIHQDRKLYCWDSNFTHCIPTSFFPDDQQIQRLWNTCSGNIWIATSNGLYCLEDGIAVLKLSSAKIHLDVSIVTEDSVTGGYAAISYPREYLGIWKWAPHGPLQRTTEGERQIIQALDARDGYPMIYAYSYGDVRTTVNNVWSSLNPLPKELSNAVLFRYRSNGDLWVATESNLNLFRTSLPLWNFYALPPPTKANITAEIMLTHDSTLWTGTDSGIIIRTAGGKTRFLDSIPGQKLLAITGIAEDNEDNIWISSGYNFIGAYCWNGKQWRYAGPNEGLTTYIHRIEKDREGRMWFLGLATIFNDSSNEPGAFLYENDRFTKWGTKEGLIYGRVYAFAEGTDHSLWFGTNGGISCFKNGTWQHWTMENGLRSNRVFTLAVDNTNTVWFGHQALGLGSIRDGKVRYYSAEDGLVSDVVWEVKVDSLNRVWVATSQGLSCFENGKWSSFDESIGLTNLRLWPILPMNDKVYIGTLGSGVAILNLKALTIEPPQVLLSQPVVAKNSALLRWQPFSFWGELPTRIIGTRYKLDDESWSDWTTEREKVFFNLPAGKHLFTVEAKGIMTKLKSSVSIVTVTIEQPFYLQPLYLFSVGSLATGLIILGIFIYTRRRRHQIELQLSEERYRGIVRDQTDLITRFSPDGTLRFVNEAYCRYFKLEEMNVLGHKILEFVPIQIYAELAKHFEYLQSLTPANPTAYYTQEVVLPNGEIRWLYFVERAFFDEKGALVEFQAVGRDISEFKQMEEALRQSEQDYRGLFESAHDAIIIFNPGDEVILDANQRACEIYGFERSEFIGMSLETISENVARGKERTKETLAKGFYYQFETVHYRKDGARMYIDINASVFKYQGRDAILSINRDVTERKLNELAIVRREAILEALSFAGQQFMQEGPLEDKIQNVLERLGIATNVSTVLITENYTDPKGLLMVRSHYRWTNPENSGQILQLTTNNFAFAAYGLERWVEVLGKGMPLYGSIADFPEKERGIFLASNVTSLLIMPVFVNKRWWGSIGFEECVHERQWTSAEIDALNTAANILGGVLERRERERTVQMLAHALEGISECVCITDLENTLIFVNDAFCTIYGFEKSELLGKSITIIRDEKTAIPVSTILPSTKSGGWQGELINRKKNGALFPVYLSTSTVKDENGSPVALLGIAKDITEQKRIEQQIREQASLLDISTDAIIVEDMKHNIYYWNKGAERLYGWKANEVIGKNSHRMLPETESSSMETIFELLMAKGEWHGELTITANDGRVITVDSRRVLVRDESGKPISILIVDTDITEKKILEKQFFRSQRLESIGTLAGGIAHDLNNVLAPILLSVELLKSRFPDSQSSTLLSTLETSASRGKEIIKQVLTFARGVSGERVPLQPRHFIKELEHLIRETFPKSLQYSFNIPDQLWTVIGDPTQIHQVLLNICLNARDAMPSGGRLTITAENIMIDEEYVRTHLNAKPGAYVSISISDTGSGIPPEHIDKIFDPFFTTKEVGKGTGLGLSTVHAIVTGHKGFLTVSSKPGSGSTFMIFLPVSHNTHHAGENQPSVIEYRGNGELILVVDDEEAIREVATKILEMGGYKVITANDGTEALGEFVQHQQEIRLVITDILMPYMDGIALIRSLRQIEPSVTIIAASGQEADAEFLTTAGIKVEKFLPKPFTAETLLSAIYSVLHKTQT